MKRLYVLLDLLSGSVYKTAVMSDTQASEENDVTWDNDNGLVWVPQDRLEVCD